MQIHFQWVRDPPRSIRMSRGLTKTSLSRSEVDALARRYLRGTCHRREGGWTIEWESGFGRADLDLDRRQGILSVARPLPAAIVAGLLDRWVLPAIIRLHGYFVIHASAVEVAGQALAFAGASGSGKSTSAAELSARGFPVVADDYVCVGVGKATLTGELAESGHGSAEQEGGVPPVMAFGTDRRLRLRRDAWERLRESLGPVPWRVGAGGKLIAARPPSSNGLSNQRAPLPLGAVVLLDGGGEERECQQLGPEQATRALLKLAYGPGPWEPAFVVDHFRLASRTARSCPIWRLRRTRDPCRDALLALDLLAVRASRSVGRRVANPQMSTP